jgi:hypothetical protein
MKNQKGLASLPLLILLILILAGLAIWWVTNKPETTASNIPHNDYKEWSRDTTNVYFRGTRVQAFDASSFEILFPGFGFGKDCWTSEFVKDKNGIYVSQGLEASHGFGKIEGADPATFEVLKSGSFSRDRNYLYNGTTRTNLDPKNPANYDSHCG